MIADVLGHTWPMQHCLWPILPLLLIAPLLALPATEADAAAEAPAATGTTPALAWKNVEGTRVPVPPAEHPRLYLRAAQAAQIAARLTDPVLAPVVHRLQAQAAKSEQYRIEWDALQYLVNHDAASGRATVAACLEFLQKTELPNQHDACRYTGRVMVTGAIVYDWLYPLLTAAEKQAFIKELIRLAKTQECGYPPTGQGSVTGHSSEAMIMREMVSAGIAIYDEYPEMYDLAAGRFFREHLPARNWFYGGHAYHQGDSYGPYRYSADTFPLYIFDRLDAGNVYNREQHYVPYYFMYATRPDGQRLRNGDTFAHRARRGQPWGEGIGTLLTASYYGDGFLLDQALRQGGISDTETIFDFLWRDTALASRPLSELPLTRYFGSPFGWMIARTGWGQDAVIAEMKVNEYNFVNHQHLDAGAFQIYYKGGLAIDSGLYEGDNGAYGSEHCLNYQWRTIAHNALLVYDPAETFSAKGDYGNDGGQRLPNGRTEARTLEVLLKPENGYRTGQVLAHGSGPDVRQPDYTLLQGDITAAYSSKVRQVTRSFVFLNLKNAQVPAALVVFDRVTSTNPAYRKFWLLHTQEEPRLDGASAVVDCTQHGAQGRLALDVLLPRADNIELSKVGGPGKEFWVFGRNYPNSVDARQMETNAMEVGAWRLELSPRTPAAEDLFLNVMQVTDRAGGAHWPVHRLETADRTGCLIEGPQASWAVLLRRDGRRTALPVEMNVPGQGVCHVLVTDLAPGRWQARHAGNGSMREIDVSGESGAAWFEGPAGAWTLAPLPQ